MPKALVKSSKEVSKLQLRRLVSANISPSKNAQGRSVASSLKTSGLTSGASGSTAADDLCYGSSGALPSGTRRVRTCASGDSSTSPITHSSSNGVPALSHTESPPNDDLPACATLNATCLGGSPTPSPFLPKMSSLNSLALPLLVADKPNQPSAETAAVGSTSPPRHVNDVPSGVGDLCSGDDGIHDVLEEGENRTSGKTSGVGDLCSGDDGVHGVLEEGENRTSVKTAAAGVCSLPRPVNVPPAVEDLCSGIVDSLDAQLECSVNIDDVWECEELSNEQDVQLMQEHDSDTTPASTDCSEESSREDDGRYSVRRNEETVSENPQEESGPAEGRPNF